MTKPNRIGYTRRRDQLIPDQTLGYDTANAVLGLFSYLKYQGSDAQIDLTTIRLRIVEDRIEVTADDPRHPLGMRRTPIRHHFGDDDHPVHECHPDRCGMWATTTQPDSTDATAAAEAFNGRGPWPGEPTTLGNYARTTTAGRCPSCGHDYDQTPTEACTTPERHDKPTPLATPTPGDAAEPCIVEGLPCRSWPNCRC